MPMAAQTRPARNPSLGADVFVSPRIVDEAAFARYVDQLRAVIERAGAVAEEARGVSERMRDLPALEARTRRELEAAARLLSVTEKEAAEARRLSAQTCEKAALLERLQAEADSIAESASDRLKATLEDVVKVAEQRLIAAEEAVNTRLTDLEERIRRAERSVEAGLSYSEQRLKQTQVRIEQFAAERQEALDDLLQRTGASMENIDRRAADILLRLDEALTSAETDPRFALVREAISEADRLADDVRAIMEVQMRLKSEAEATAAALSEMLAACKGAAPDDAEHASRRGG